MTYRAYFPTTESARIICLGSFANKLPSHATTLGLSDADVKSGVSDANCGRWLIQDLSPSVRKSSLETSASNHTMLMDASAGMQPIPVPDNYDDMPELRPAGILSRIFNLVQRIKLSSGYSHSIGQDMGIIGGVDNTDYPAPEYDLAQENGPDGIRVKVNLVKQGHDAVSIESQRNNGPGMFSVWTLPNPGMTIGHCTHLACRKYVNIACAGTTKAAWVRHTVLLKK